MNDNNDSLLEIAIALMKRKRNPQSLDLITNEVFQKKGMKGTEQEIAQFQVDFMLSGYFICCGEDKNGNHLWDLKNRQPSSMLDKDGGYLEDIYADDEDVVKNELKDDYLEDEDKLSDSYLDDDDDEEEEDEEDDLEDELGLVEMSEDDESSTMEITVDDDEEEEDEEEDDIEEELKKK